MMQRTMAKSPRENRSLFEDEYRDEVTEYMHEMDVSKRFHVGD